MVMPAAFGFWNGVLPILGLMALAVALPLPFARWIGDSQGRLAAILLVAAMDLVLIGVAVLWILTRAEDAAATFQPLEFGARSVKMALAWGPVWGLVWLVRAQGIERRKGLRMGREVTDGRHS